MLSRRLLRVKVMQIVYSYQKNGDSNLQRAEKELLHSISKSSELYHLYLLLLLDIRLLEEKRIEQAKLKRIPSAEDLKPNVKFINNAVLNQLGNNEMLLKYIRQTGISWVNFPELVKKIMNEIRQSALYIEYMAEEENDYEKDRKFIVKLIEKIIAPSEDLYHHFEEESIYWNDEAEFIVSMLIKTIKEFKFEIGEDQTLIPEYKDEEDREFVKTLFRKVILNSQDLNKIIDENTKNWDLERVAFIDIIIMQLALTEACEFSKIPLNVSLNEYIEIAKHYSTEKSSVFINGILDKAFGKLKKEKKIFKANGEGLSTISE